MGAEYPDELRDGCVVKTGDSVGARDTAVGEFVGDAVGRLEGL